MTGFSPLGWCGLALLALAGCGAPATPVPAPAAKPPAPIDQLSRIVEGYWDEHKPTEHAISPQFLADSLSIERRYLTQLADLPRDQLDASSRLTYDIFRRRREIAIEGFTFPDELLPVDPFDGMPQRFAARAGQLAHDAATAAAYADFLRDIDDYVRWTQQAIANMRQGIRRGYTSPRTVVERMLPILERLGVDDSANPFYALLRSMPDSIKAAERPRLTKDMTSAIVDKLLPANRALHEFLQKEYLPRARAGLAFSELPLGSQWYAYRIKRTIGTPLSADEINRIGVAEVERLGSPPAHEGAPAPANGLLNAYTDLEVQVHAALPTLFSELPKSNFEIRSSEWLPLPATALYYQPGGPNGVPPAVVFVSAGKAARPLSIAGFLQAGLPGRHLQIALQRERTDLPRFRRFGAEAAFTEGWGLYAVSLGEALGLYPDEPAKSDATAAEMRCAVALVVDTGLHAKGWTRGQAFDYLRTHLGVDDPDAQSLIDWYATNPAEAMACMMGGMKFRALRAHAQQLLGGRFDLREFHHEILKDGAMPPDILEAKMKAWMDASK
ncbi:MAG TPA: DUF885 domain-containing protein [Steroidobacteraceae bacterium]|nr:DUF885 domain-containing protein [Steroidobacteraceae bacterium]